MTTTTNATNQFDAGNLVKAARPGAVAGLGGGLVFGAMMANMGMLPMIGMMIGVESAVVGFIIHMLISAFIGATYGALSTFLPTGWVANAISGTVYGVIWWVLGALIAMPVALGMFQMVFVVGDMQISSLIGHAIFGVITGVLYVALRDRI